MAALRRVDESHGHGTRSARSGLVDHKMVAYRVPAKWRTLTEEQRGMGSVGGFKRSSRDNFLMGYELFQCRVEGVWGPQCGGWGS
jgi:hypothetical protein